MGNIYSSFETIHFKELQTLIGSDILLLNTLPQEHQSYLIYGTLCASKETDQMNFYLKTNRSIEIILYGKDHLDRTMIEKYNQLKQLGFTRIRIYFGGLFEWALLQDIYGPSLFKTHGTVKDPLDIFYLSLHTKKLI
jgi:hypothetical protein